ncbi:hypothetical protein D3C80_1402280 [compost metagenome]
MGTPSRVRPPTAPAPCICQTLLGGSLSLRAASSVARNSGMSAPAPSGGLVVVSQRCAWLAGAPQKGQGWSVIRRFILAAT